MIADEAPGIARFIEEAGATLVPEAKARELGLLAPDDSYVMTGKAPDVPATTDDPDGLRKELVFFLREIGLRQTGAAVSLGWCHAAAVLLAEEATGECDFDLHENTNAGAIRIILESATRLLASELKKASPHADSDIPF